jgi:hypothetical protein
MPHQFDATTSPNTNPSAYVQEASMLAEGSGGNAQGVPRRVHSAPQPRPPREPVQIDVDAVRECKSCIDLVCGR